MYKNATIQNMLNWNVGYHIFIAYAGKSLI